MNMKTILMYSYNDILLIVIILAMLVIFAAVLVTLKALRTMLRVTMPELLTKEKSEKQKAELDGTASEQTWWQKVMGLRPMAEEKDLLIEHEYDGIRELDNPVPVWFNAMFYVSIVFAVIYLLVYHVFGWGLNQDQEYEREMAQAEAAKQEWLAQSTNNIDETNVQVDNSPAVIESGFAIYTQNCAVCHGAAGEGGIGPNMADEYWIHGGEIEDVFRIVKYGVLDKGMIPWEQSLTPMQIAEVSNYILTFRGTNPPNAKEPQGDKVEYRTGDKETAPVEEQPVPDEEEGAAEPAEQQG